LRTIQKELFETTLFNHPQELLRAIWKNCSQHLFEITLKSSQELLITLRRYLKELFRRTLQKNSPEELFGITLSNIS